MKENYDIIIVGAGISGLACAQKCNENSKDFAGGEGGDAYEKLYVGGLA